MLYEFISIFFFFKKSFLNKSYLVTLWIAGRKACEDSNFSITVFGVFNMF